MAKKVNREASRQTPPRRGLNREEAAVYYGISPSFFDTLIKKGQIPKGKRMGSRVVYDLVKLDSAFDDLHGEEQSNEWDEVA